MLYYNLEYLRCTLVYVPNLESVRFPGAIGIPEDYSSFAEQAVDNSKHQRFFFLTD